MKDLVYLNSFDEAERTIQSAKDELDPSKLLNVVEGGFIDFKLKYELDEGSRYELAKDVSSFLNAEGGYIVVGIKTAKDDTSKIEFSDSIEPIQDISPKIEGCLKEYLFPNPRKYIDLFFIGADNTGIIIIKILPSPEMHLIMRQYADGSKIKQNVFGFAQRKGSDSIPLEKEELHRRLKLGSSEQSQNISLILELLTSRDTTRRNDDSAKTRLQQHMKELE